MATSGSTRPHRGLARGLESLREVQAARAELVAQLRRLRPAWGELRAVLNEVNRRLET
jgi:hypothetical protein